MERTAIVPKIPLSAWLYCAGFLLVATCVWAFLFSLGSSADSVIWAFSFLVAIVFVGFGLSFWCLITLIPTFHRPAWLSQKQAVSLSAVCFATQSAVAGVLTLLEAWPHRDLWFLGALPFAFAG